MSTADPKTTSTPTTARKRSNKLTKRPPSIAQPPTSSTAGPLANVLLWVMSIALVAVTLVLVPGPVQDKLLVAIGRGEVETADVPVRTRIYANKEKRDYIVRAFKHAWFGYERHAFGSDLYHPLSQSGSNLTTSEDGISTGVGYTVIDSLSTFLVMSLSAEAESLGPSYRKIRKWLKEEHTWDVDGNFNTFELTIRMLGGLLSAHWAEWEIGITPGKGMNVEGRDDEYDPNDLLYLHKAVDLAERLSKAFETRSGLPLSNINLKTGVASKSDQEHGLVSLAEVGTLQLEFRYLSQVLLHQLQLIPPEQLSTVELPSFLKDEDGEPKNVEDLKKYWNIAEAVMKITREGTRGRLPSVFLNPEDGEFVISPIKLGSRGDSYFEYLLKQYLQTSKTEPDLLRMWDDAIDQISETLAIRTPKGSLYVAELQPEQEESGEIAWRRVPKQDHLACFLAGSLMLAAAHTKGTNDRNVVPASIPPKLSDFELGSRAARDWKMGEEMLKACYDTHQTNTGLAPEIIHFRTPTDPEWLNMKAKGEWYIKGGPLGTEPPIDARYILRPEIIESIFIAYRLSGDHKYRRWGWKIFEAIEKHCKVPSGGYAGIRNVDETPPVKENLMESFFLSETLKYLYLLFSDESVLPIEQIVFNTEAHPFPKFTPEWDTPFM